MVGEEKRHQMMQNLFGDQSEEEKGIESEHESNRQPDYASTTIMLFGALGTLISLTIISLGSLKYWYECNKVDILMSKAAVWDDGAIPKALDCAAHWVKNLPFVRSLSGIGNFF